MRPDLGRAFEGIVSALQGEVRDAIAPDGGVLIMHVLYSIQATKVGFQNAVADVLDEENY